MTIGTVVAYPYAADHYCSSRNGHSCGFWDRGLGELRERLTRAAKALGTSDLYIGDDERVYVS